MRSRKEISAGIIQPWPARRWLARMHLLVVMVGWYGLGTTHELRAALYVCCAEWVWPDIVWYDRRTRIDGPCMIHTVTLIHTREHLYIHSSTHDCCAGRIQLM